MDTIHSNVSHMLCYEGRWQKELEEKGSAVDAYRFPVTISGCQNTGRQVIERLAIYTLQFSTPTGTPSRILEIQISNWSARACGNTVQFIP